jgi:Skp family chaperone for outer membrane proteins
MKKFGSIAAAFAFVVFLGMSALAQAPAGKIGWVETGAFVDEKEGILKFVNAYKALEAESKPRVSELTTLQTRIQTIATDIQKMTANTAVPVKESDVIAKRDEGEKLAREFEFKKKEYEAWTQKRGNEIVGPVQADIGKALGDFGKSKGYMVIFDVDKLAQAGAIVHLDPAANITKEFITYYNARPAGAATAVAPK